MKFRDIIATLSGPDTGYITLGYAAREVSTSTLASTQSLTDRLRDLIGGSKDPEVDELTAINAIETTVREATRGRLTFDCERSSASHGLVVFVGPPEWLHRDAIGNQRTWLREELTCRELRSGDSPRRDSVEIAVVLVLSGVTEVPRLTELRSVATEQ